MQLIEYHKKSGISPEIIAMEQSIKLMTNLIPEAYGRANREVPPGPAEFRLNELFACFTQICDMTGWRRSEAREAHAALKRLPPGSEQQREREHIMRSFIGEVVPPLNARVRDNSVGFDGTGFSLVEMADGKLLPGRGLDLQNAKVFAWFFGQEDRPDGRKTAMQEMQYRNFGFRDPLNLQRTIEALDAGKSPFQCFGGIHVYRVGKALADATGQELDFKVYTENTTFRYSS